MINIHFGETSLLSSLLEGFRTAFDTRGVSWDLRFFGARWLIKVLTGYM